MNVTDAVMARKTTRDFLAEPVDDGFIRTLLEKASRAPSGGNLQPWRIWVINGESMAAFRGHMTEAPRTTTMEYDVYPANLWEPHRTYRYTGGLSDLPAGSVVGRPRAGSQLHRCARRTDAVLWCRDRQGESCRPDQLPRHRTGSGRRVCDLLVMPDQPQPISHDHPNSNPNRDDPS